MCYPSFPFPPSTPLFPKASVVHTYLEDYSHHFDLKKFIRFNTVVQNVDRKDDKWIVKSISDNQPTPETYDLVIVANGHYRIPRIPQIRGAESWIKSGRAKHAVYYRHPLPEHRDSTLLIVGGGPSGTDISADLRGVARVLIHSVTGGQPEEPEAPDYKRRARVVEFLQDGEVRFADGMTERVDACILATGYDFDYPFLPALERGYPDGPPLPDVLRLSQSSVFPLARHVFPLGIVDAPMHTLAFVGLPIQVAPFPVMEAQARAAVRALREPSSLDPTQEAVAVIARLDRIRNTVSSEDNAAIARAWHRLPDDAQFDYRDELNTWAGGGPTDVSPQWARSLYKLKNPLRAAWRALERDGLAGEWVKDVGKGGTSEWVDLMYKVLERGDPQAAKGKL
jgi:hypothetical protein